MFYLFLIWKRNSKSMLYLLLPLPLLPFNFISQQNPKRNKKSNGLGRGVSRPLLRILAFANLPNCNALEKIKNVKVQIEEAIKYFR